MINKRFTSFLVTVGVLSAGLVWGDPENYSAFATSIGLAYGAYLAGQSYTDGVDDNGQD